jgi:hypothetical protein
MNSDTIYEEKIFAKVTGGLLWGMAVVMLIIMIYVTTIEPLDEEPYLYMLFIILFFLFIILGLIFGRLVIRVDYQNVVVGFGIIKKRIPWENIKEVYQDETSAIKYGGAGIRTTRLQGEWVLAYIVVGGPRVVLRMKEGKFKRFVFSTKNPEEVLNVIKGQMVLTK